MEKRNIPVGWLSVAPDLDRERRSDFSGGIFGYNASSVIDGGPTAFDGTLNRKGGYTRGQNRRIFERGGAAGSGSGGGPGVTAAGEEEVKKADSAGGHGVLGGGCGGPGESSDDALYNISSICSDGWRCTGSLEMKLSDVRERGSRNLEKIPEKCEHKLGENSRRC